MKKILARTLAFAFAATVCTGALAQTRKPNILVIWGDDIGRDNISAYSMGIMGYRTPNIDRIAKEGAIFTDSYAQQSCTAGRASFILGQHPFRTGLLTIGMPGSPQGIPDWAPTIADLLKAPGLRHRPVRQEPPGRPRLAPADGARLRRVPRQPLPPERRGRARDLLLPEGSGVQEEVRPARRAAHLVGRQGRPEDRGHRPAHPRSGCRRSTSRSTTPRTSSSDTQVKAGQAVLRLVQHDAHARLDASEAVGRRAAPASASTPTAWSSTTTWSARLLKQLDDLGHRRQHHRRLRHRQRRRDRHLAGRRHHAVPRREGHHLGRRLPRADARALAGRDQAGHHRQRHLLAGRLAADAAGRGRRAQHRREGEATGYTANGKTWKVHLDGYNFLPFFKGEAKKGPREEIFYFGQGGELNAVRWNDWKVNFAVQNGNIATASARRARLAGDRQPARRPLREGAARIRAVPALVRGQHLAVRAGAGRSSRRS